MKQKYRDISLSKSPHRIHIRNDMTQVQHRTTPQIMIYNHVLQAVTKDGYSERTATHCACSAIQTYQQEKRRRYQQGWVEQLIQTHVAKASVIEQEQPNRFTV